VSQLATKIVIEGAVQAKADLVAMDTNSRLAQAGMKMLQNASADAISSRLSAEIDNAQGGLMDLASRANAAGLDISKLSTLQAKAAESAARLGVAESQYASAQQKANELIQSGTASAEQIALAQSKAALSAEKVNVAENAVYVAMEKVNTESNRLNVALKENADAAISTASAMDIVKSAMANVGEGMQSAINWMSDFASKAVSSAGEFVSSFNSVSDEMTMVSDKMVTTEATAKESSGGFLSGFKNAAGGILDFGSKVGFALMGVQMGVQMVSGAVTAVIGPAEAYQEVLKQTNDVLKSTQGAAGMSAQAIADLATSLSHSTFYSRDAAQAGENLLLTFTGIGKDVFPLATKTMLDMSKAMGQDVKSTAIQMGKALNDPAKGLTALTRVGVTFTDSQKNMIKSMVAAGNTAGAQKIMLQELQREFGGSSDATQTLAGKWEILKNRFEEVKENIGNFLLPILSNLASFVIDRIMPALDDFGNWFSNIAMPVLTAWGHALQVYVIDKFNDLKTFMDKNVMPKLVEFWSYVTTKIVPILIVWGHNIQVYVIDKFNDLKAFIEKNVMPAISTFWGYVQTKIVPILVSWGHNIQVYVIDKFNNLKTFITSQVLPRLAEFWSFVQTKIVPTLQVWGNNIKIWVIDKLSDLWSFIKTKVMPSLSDLWSFITTQIVPVLVSWGTTIKTWVIDKLSDLWSFITTKVMPKLVELWSFVQTQIVSAFSNWGQKIADVQTNISNFKTFIDTQVIPVIKMLWQWINDHIVPVFQSLWDIAVKVSGSLDSLKTSTGHLMDSLKHLWDVVSPILTPALEFLAYTAGVEAGGKFDGLKQAIDVCGDVLNMFVKNVSMGIDALATLIDWLATAIGWVNDFDAAITNAAADLLNMVGIQASHVDSSGKPIAPSGGTGGGAVKSFASGIENFGGGFAYVHAGEILTYLPKGSNVYNPSQSANILNGAGLASTGSGLQQQTVHIHNYIDGKQITNNVGPRIIKSARTNGPLRGKL
jgi:hypothetical protein